MLKAPAFTVAAVLTLALAIGANTAIFTVVNGVLLRALPYRDAGRLVHVSGTEPYNPLAGTSYRSFELWKTRSRSFEDMAVYYKNTGFSRVVISGLQEPEAVQAGFSSANFFPLLGVPPKIGRVFTPGEEQWRNRVAVISEPLWRRWFGSAEDVIGKTLRVDDKPFTVIGVMPAEFQFPGTDTQLWMPITTNNRWGELMVCDPNHGRGFYMRFNVVARLKAGVSRQAAQKEMSRIVAQLEQQDPDLNMGAGIQVAPIRLEIAENARLALLVLVGAVMFVLLIACSNVANLTLARTATREREMAIRMALGARRRRLICQLLVESATLSVISGLLGVALASVAVRVLVMHGPPNLPRLNEAGIDGPVLAFTMGISILAAIFFGLMPAWKASDADPIDSLQAAGRSASQSAGRSRTRHVVVVFECAVSVVLLAGTGLLLRSLAAIESVDPGFRPQHVLTMRLEFPANTPDARKTAFFKELYEQIRALPGVQRVGGISRLFELGTASSVALRAVEGRDLPANREFSVTWSTINGEYFEAMGVPLLQGRFFSHDDGPNSPHVAIIDQSMARQYWPSQDPIGKRFKGQDRRGANDDWLTVIGVVGDKRRNGLENRPGSHVFEWEDQAGHINPDLVVRTSGDPLSLAAAVRAAVRSIEPGAVIVDLTTLQQQLDQQTAPRRYQTWVLSIFAALAVILSGTGIYGVMHYSVAQRRHEIGVRMALGATAQSVLRMVLRQGLTLALIGVAAGLVGSWWLARLLKSMLYAVKPADPLTFAGVTTLLLAVALTATAVPAWRAARVDPSASLRDE
jgi:putative ABC transport system permease protein